MKPIDLYKLERVKRETKKLIVKQGYSGTSIAAIAKQANVSDGYLYRHYKSKSALVSDLFEKQLQEFHDYLFQQLDSTNTIAEFIDAMCEFLFIQNKSRKYELTFAHMLIYEHEFKYPESRRIAIHQLSILILKKGQQSKEFNENIVPFDIMVTILLIPIKYIEYYNKKYLPKPELNDADKQKIITLCLKALN